MAGARAERELTASGTSAFPQKRVGGRAPPGEAVVQWQMKMTNRAALALGSERLSSTR